MISSFEFNSTFPNYVKIYSFSKYKSSNAKKNVLQLKSSANSLHSKNYNPITCVRIQKSNKPKKQIRKLHTSWKVQKPTKSLRRASGTVKSPNTAGIQNPCLAQINTQQNSPTKFRFWKFKETTDTSEISDEDKRLDHKIQNNKEWNRSFVESIGEQEK